MTKKLTFCAMLAVMGAGCLLASNLLQSNTVFLYLFSTLFCYIATVEYGYRYGVMTATVVTVLGFLTVSNKISMAFYTGVAAYYPIIKHVTEHKLSNKALRWVLKLLWIALSAAAAYLILRQFLTVKLPLYLLFLGGMAVFVIYDIALTMGIRFYEYRLKQK